MVARHERPAEGGRYRAPLAADIEGATVSFDDFDHACIAGQAADGLGIEIGAVLEVTAALRESF
jgi:hypothetical protein